MHLVWLLIVAVVGVIRRLHTVLAGRRRHLTRIATVTRIYVGILHLERLTMWGARLRTHGRRAPRRTAVR